MKRKTTALIVAITLICSFLLASDFEKVRSYQIGPGTIYSYYKGTSRTWAIHLTEIDLSNPYISLETIKANDRMFSKETPSSMSSRLDASGHRSVCAINGDFYNTSNGQPINNQVINGEFLQGYTYHRSAFTYSDDGIGGITIPSFSGTVILKDSLDANISHGLNVVNNIRYTDYIVLYNKYMGSSTGTNEHGYEVLANPISDWVVNDTVLAVVEAAEDFVGNMAIPAGKIILSGHGTGRTFLLENCSIGDTVRIVQSLANTHGRVTQLVGGGPWILKNGVDVTASNTEGVGSSFYAVRHPRTGVGISADSTKAYFMVVDGRSTHSIGMTCHEMADFFVHVGAAHATNLDGGGSSGFVVRNSLMNDPSDGSERAVANGLVCVSSAPNGSFTYLQQSKDSIAVYKNKSVDAGFSGWDEYYNPKAIPDWSTFTVSYDTTLGTFSENVFAAKEKNGDTFIKVEYGTEADSVLIHIIELTDLSVYPDTITTDSVNMIKYEVTAVNENGGRGRYTNDHFKFFSLDPSIAAVNDLGEIIGVGNGETGIVVAYGDQTDTAHVIVEIGSGEVVVNEIETIAGWTVSSDTYINDSETNIQLVDRSTATGSKAVQVNYSRTGDEDGNIYLETASQALYGVPSYILIDVLSDSIKHWVYVMLEDSRGVDYSVKCSSSLRYNDGYRTQYLDLANLLPADGEQLYPLKFKGVRFRIDDKATSGSLYFDRIRLIYPNWTSVEDNNDHVIPSEFKLKQNYPNPFNPITAISYQLSAYSNVDLSVYDINGKKVATLINGGQGAGTYTLYFDASDIPGGLYFYRLMTDNWADTKKMLLIK